MSDIDHLVPTATAAMTVAIKPLLEMAFKVGFNAGKEAGEIEAAKKFRAKMEAILGDSPATPAPPESQKSSEQLTIEADTGSDGGRAAPGTVKPVILKIVTGSRHGMTTREIANGTGFKFNSIRGTLWALEKEGLIYRDPVAGRWRGVLSRESPAAQLITAAMGTSITAAVPPQQNEPPNE